MVGSIPYHILRVVTKVQDTSGEIKTRVRSRSNASEKEPQSATLKRSHTDFEQYQNTRQRSRTLVSLPSGSLALIHDVDEFPHAAQDDTMLTRPRVAPRPEVIVKENTIPLKGRKKSASVGSNASTDSSQSSGSAALSG